MWGEDDVAEAVEGVIGGRWLGVEDVERGTGKMALLERRHQRLLVEDAAAAGIDQVGPRAQALQRLGVNDLAGRGRHRHVQGQNLRARQQLFPAYWLDA